MRYLLGCMLLLAAVLMVLPVTVDIPELLRLDDESPNYLLVMLGGWAVLYLAAAGVAIWDAVRLVRRGDLEGLRQGAVFTKLAGIPFFVMNFVSLGFITQSLLFFGIGFLLAPIFITWTYLVMLPTSVYGLACLVALKRVPAVSSTFFAVHVVLHLLFVADIISTLIVAGRATRVLRYGRPPPESLR